MSAAYDGGAVEMVCRVLNRLFWKTPRPDATTEDKVTFWLFEIEGVGVKVKWNTELQSFEPGDGNG